MNAKAYLDYLRATYAAAADHETGRQMAAYMRDQFLFYGLKTPVREALSRQVIAELGYPDVAWQPELCRLCFGEEKREAQYFVRDLLRSQVKRLEPEYLPLFEEFILTRSWWDTVDFLAPKLAGPILLRHPELIVPVTQKWIGSDSRWLQRSALIFQLDYKKHTRADLLFDYILRRADSKEFFVQKGAGWALRQYSRTDPDAVRVFLQKHADRLAPLTVREGGKYV